MLDTACGGDNPDLIGQLIWFCKIAERLQHRYIFSQRRQERKDGTCNNACSCNRHAWPV